MLKAGSAARRVSLRLDPPWQGTALAELIEQYLHDVDRELQSIAPGWVGHCKLLADAGGQVAYGSITMAGDTVRWTGMIVPAVAHAELTVYAAIYNLTDEQVAGVLDAYLPQLVPATTA